MKIIIIGSGGRENALGWKLYEEGHELFFVPGNGGSFRYGTPVPIDVNNFAAIADFAKEHGVDLVIVTPDDQLAAGGIDYFVARGLCSFGPTKTAARVESSKLYAKTLMDAVGVPTAPWRGFTEAQYEEALIHTLERSLPFMVKKSGNALGKGAYPCRTRQQAEVALCNIMVEKKHGSEGNGVVIEDFLPGKELSMHVLTDGKTIVRFPASQDFKRVLEDGKTLPGGTNPNTGSMGTIVPLPAYEGALERATGEIVSPILKVLADDGSRFKGLLYPGLMVDEDGQVRVLEYNARFGDSECQAYMRLLESDLYPHLNGCINGTLKQCGPLRWRAGAVVCVNLVSGGYPNEYKKGFPISGIAGAENIPEVVVFHAETKFEDGIFYTNGGRVLNVTAWGETLELARARAYEAVSRIRFEGMHYRRDIGADI